ncbi:MAG: amino acid ABC transporter ATP-binding protein [Chloroflexi bacterium]|nr:amino acid ABC transporter ATP-binding protein [Chloroflexota bacterium]
MADSIVRITDLCKAFGPLQVLKGVTLQVEPREVVCVIGRSGSGKSTLLRSINFLEEPTSGRVEVDGIVVDETLASKERRQRIHQIRLRTGMVFQEFNLFPHKSVIENIIEALLVVKRLPRAQAVEIGESFLSKVGLLQKRDEYPARLSGGQKQRVAIARALAMDPKVMLFDEPTSALDPELIGEVIRVMEDVANEGMTMIVVTHEMSFARDTADRIIYMEDGVIVESGSPSHIFTQPHDARTLQFLQRYLDHSHNHS